ncbi:4796_t:CDS:2 [Rhizophagus irregularis]|nr:4796_t:CDS:2 [Rhizophagus irregularis]
MGETALTVIPPSAKSNQTENKLKKIGTGACRSTNASPDLLVDLVPDPKGG